MKLVDRLKIVKRITKLLCKDKRVYSIFVTGSFVSKELTQFSDIDLWIVFSNESGINAFKDEVGNFFSKFGVLLGVYNCTAHHYFVIYNSGLQVDLNLVTAAHYFSIKNSSKNATVLFDRNTPVLQDDSSKKRLNVSMSMALKGYTTLERATSKFLKGNYFVVLRFLDEIRYNTILPMLPFIGEQTVTSPVSLDIKKLSQKVRNLMISSYAKPTHESCKESLLANLDLLQLFCKENDINTFLARAKKIKKIVITNKQI